MSTKHIAQTVTWVDEFGVTQTMTVYEAQQGVRGGKSERKWYVCTQCRYSFPEDQVTLINNTPYCIPNGCYEEHEL